MLVNTNALMLVLDRIYECTIWDEDTVFNVLNFCGDGFFAKSDAIISGHVHDV